MTDMKRTICCLLVLLIGTSALLCGCGKDAKNTITITDCEIYVQVSAVSGKELSFTVTSGMGTPGGDMRGGDMTPPEGEIPGADFGGEIPELPEGDAGSGFPGEMPEIPEGMPGQIPGGDNWMNAITGIITVGDTDIIRKSQNGTEIPADLSDIASGAMLKITFDHSGNLTKILIAQEMFGMPEQWEIPQGDNRLQ